MNEITRNRGFQQFGWQSVGAILLLASVLGCGSRTGSLNGTVTFNAQPVTSGTVTALGPDNIPMASKIQAYDLRDVGVGKVRLAIDSPDPTTVPPGPVGEPNARETPPPANGNWREIPAKYSNLDASELTVDLHGGLNRFDIVLRP